MGLRTEQAWTQFKLLLGGLRWLLVPLICVSGHDYYWDRAVNREPEGYKRVSGGGEDELVPACYIVEECSRCGSTRKVFAPVSVAERHNLPREWED